MWWALIEEIAPRAEETACERRWFDENIYTMKKKRITVVLIHIT